MRIIKLLLVTPAANLVFSLLDSVIIYALLTSPSGATGTQLSVLSWGFTLGTTLIAALIHRFFHLLCHRTLVHRILHPNTQGE